MARSTATSSSKHLALAATAVLLWTACGAQAATVVTTYAYNRDGAPVAASVMRNGQTATTTYFTWDDFLPDQSDPSRGTVRVGNGRLVAIGPRPGEYQAAHRFEFDSRSRPIRSWNEGKPGTSYDYDASGMLASMRLEGGDRQRFYYGPTAQVVNQRHDLAVTTASFLAGIRFFDGREQAMLTPRKDVAGVYDAHGEEIQAYAYDAYGAPRHTPATTEGLTPDGSRYDMEYNPFGYAGELRDPVSQAYFLRARWYLPEHHVFLSRDPGDAVHRYGYTGGNPINRTDPTGLSYAGYRRGVGHVLGKLGAATSALAALPYIGPAMFLLQASAAGEFWHDPKAATTLGYMAAWAGASALLEIPALDRLAGFRGAFGARAAKDAFLGLAQSAQSSLAAGGRRFDQAAFWEGVGATAAGVLSGRVAAGIGYRPFNLKASDIDALIGEHFANGANAGDALIFRARSDIATGWKARLRGIGGPVADHYNLGYYHTAAIGLTRDTIFASEVRFETAERQWFIARSFVDRTTGASVGVQRRMELIDRGALQDFAFVGAINTAAAQRAFETTNPTSTFTRNEHGRAIWNTGHPLQNGFHPRRNNCQDHVAGVLRALGQ